MMSGPSGLSWAARMSSTISRRSSIGPNRAADPEIGISDALGADGRIRPVARVNNGVIGQRQELPVQAEQHLLRARAREVEPADLARQQGVAGKDVVTHLEGEAARRMSRRDQHLELEGAEWQPIARDQVP